MRTVAEGSRRVTLEMRDGSMRIEKKLLRKMKPWIRVSKKDGKVEGRKLKVKVKS